MILEQEQDFVSETKAYVMNYLSLNQLSDEELETQIEQIVTERLVGQYCSIEQKLSIVLVYWVLL